MRMRMVVMDGRDRVRVSVIFWRLVRKLWIEMGREIGLVGGVFCV